MFYYNAFFLVISAFLLAVLVGCDDAPIVDTTHGKVLGKFMKTLYKEEQYAAFMGIPFALPPVKDLRFMPPQPVEPWDKVLLATKEKKACIQFNQDVKTSAKYTMGTFGSEDCLYLDIFTPATDDAKRNVIVFIYNEFFLSSYNKTKDYQPDFFIEEDVIIVTISHRLSAFGFLSLEEELLWGNSGMKDIVMGLEWTKNNIEKFGGDPNKITLMGVHGGAAAIDFLMHSKKKDLFSSAILQSCNSWGPAYLHENVRERAFELARLMGKNPITAKEVLKELKVAPAVNMTEKDLHASPKDHFKETQTSVVSFSPIVEKDPDGLIVDYPENSTVVDIPILMGFNSREGLDASSHYLIEPRFISFLNKDFPFLFPIRAKFSFDPLHDPFYDAVEEIKSYYFGKKITLKSVKDHVNYMSDVVSAYSVEVSARHYAKITTQPLYYYYFDYYSDLNENKNNLMKLATVQDGTWGAALGDELCYLFRCPDLTEQYLQHEKEQSEERDVQRKLVRMWTNFAKYGNPTPENDSVLDGLTWPAYDTEGAQYLHIGKTIEVKANLNQKNFKFWDNFFEKWEKKAINGIIRDEETKDTQKDEL